MARRILKIASLVILILLLGGLAFFLSMDFRWKDSRYLKALEKAGQSGSVFYSPAGSDSIRYIRSGLADGPAMVFIHGAPGSNRDFKAYLSDPDLCSAFNLIAVDRPGYGFSRYGKVETSVMLQAEMIAGGIPDSSIIVGHSYGGPVASSLAIFHPEKVRALVLLAPAVDPDNEKQFLVNRFMKTRFIRFLISPALEVALEEKMSHEASLRDLAAHWDGLSAPVTLVHGRKDNVVPYENVAFLEEMLKGKQLELFSPEGMNHIMIWTDFEWVKQLLLRFSQPASLK